MPKLLEKITVFVGELQKSDDSRKKKWLFGGTAVIMTVVLGFWAFYANLTLPKVSVPENGSALSDKKGSFLETFGRGLKIVSAEIADKGSSIKESVGDGLGTIKEEAQKTNELEIKNETPDIFFKKYETVPPGSFPIIK